MTSAEIGRRCAAVIREIPASPLAVLRRTAAEALLLCGAHSAGISVIEQHTGDDAWLLRRYAVVGPWAASLGTAVPVQKSPESLTLRRESPQLFCAPWPSDCSVPALEPAATEMLLVPVRATLKTFGVLWAVLHDRSRHFTSGDVRQLEAFSRCAAAAYAVSLSAHSGSHAPPDAMPLRVGRAVLSRREQQVCVLVAHGHSQREIGATLNVSTKTVETYRSRVADKLNLRSRAEFVSYALAQGWLSAR